MVERWSRWITDKRIRRGRERFGCPDAANARRLTGLQGPTRTPATELPTIAAWTPFRQDSRCGKLPPRQYRRVRTARLRSISTQGATDPTMANSARSNPSTLRTRDVVHLLDIQYWRWRKLAPDATRFPVRPGSRTQSRSDICRLSISSCAILGDPGSDRFLHSKRAASNGKNRSDPGSLSVSGQFNAPQVVGAALV